MRAILIFLGVFMTHFSFASNNPVPREPLHVLIVGAGPAGLCVAKALQNKEIYPDIIEKENQVRADGAGIAIPANGSWALAKLGIDVTSKALLVREMQFTDDQGELLIQENIENIHPEGSQFYSLSRDELIKQILSSLHRDTQIQTSLTLKSFSEENDQVRVVFSNGQSKYYDLVIGCDGIHSSLRRQAYPDENPEFLGLLTWRTVIDTPQGVTQPTYMLGSDRATMLYPMPKGEIYLYGHIFQPVKSSQTNSFSNEFSSFGGLIPQVLGSCKSAKFYIHHMERSHSVRFKLEGFGRVLLVGDAAHAFGPMLQNGAAQAFEDAYVLQELLDNTITKEQIPALINSFEKRRSPRVQKVFAISNAKIQAISDPKQIQERNETIRKTGAPNVQGFKLIMQENP